MFPHCVLKNCGPLKTQTIPNSGSVSIQNTKIMVSENDFPLIGTRVSCKFGAENVQDEHETFYCIMKLALTESCQKNLKGLPLTRNVSI